MNEKIIIKGNTSKTNIPMIISAILAVISAIIGFFWLVQYNDLPYELMYNKVGNFGAEYLTNMIVFFVISVIFIVAAVLSYLIMNNCEIVVSDKRVSGKIKFGIRVDLPLNQISSVGQGLFKSLTVATSSGVIRFWLLENRKELFSEITKLLSQFQNSQTIIHEETKLSSADEIKKFKDLLDSGIITQEEFDKKKKQLLGL